MSRFSDAPHNDFIETIVDLGLAEHSDITNTLCFFEEDKKYDFILMTIDALKAFPNISVIVSQGNMQWIFQTLADVFCFGRLDNLVPRVLKLYESWLDVKETNKPKYITEHYVECAKIMIGQMTIPFINVRNEEREVENHARYCLNVIKIFNNFLLWNILTE